MVSAVCAGEAFASRRLLILPNTVNFDGLLRPAGQDHLAGNASMQWIEGMQIVCSAAELLNYIFFLV